MYFSTAAFSFGGEQASVIFMALFMLLGARLQGYLFEPAPALIPAKPTDADMGTVTGTPEIGEAIRISGWKEDRQTEIRYCGEKWSALLEDGSSSEPGYFLVSRIEGGSLVMKKDTSRSALPRM